MNILYEYLDPIEFNVSYALRSLGVTQTDIVDAIFLVREPNTEAQADELAPVQLTLSAGLRWDSRGKSLLAEIPLDQWANLSIGQRYEWRIGLKVTGATRFSELKTNPNIINIIQDFIRG